MTLTKRLCLVAAAVSILLQLQLNAQTASISATSADGRTIKATAISPCIIRVDNTAFGEAPAEAQSVLPLQPMDGIATISNCGKKLHTLGGITAMLNDSGTLTIGTSMRGSTIADTGLRTDRQGRSSISIATSGNGSFYGGGERGYSYNLSGDTLVMYNRQNYGYTGTDPRIRQMNITMPMVLSSDGYALLFDDYAAAELILSNPVKYITESTKPITYYYIAGENLSALTENLTELTGRQPLPPLWALGYITSKYGYRTQDEAVGAIDTLKQQGYPVDGIVLDLYWYGKEEDMGRLAWEPSQWPTPEKMLSGLAERGVKTVAISQPYVLKNGKAIDNYKALDSARMFMRDSAGNTQPVKIWVGEGGMFDVSNPDTRSWMRSRYKSLTDMGIGGWWGDLGEPEVHPEEGIHANGLPARLYHNRYDNDWSGIISDLYAQEYPDRRLMTLMRGGTIGLQRHSVFPWSTDVSRSWGGLEPQIRIMLNSGLSGLGYMGSDLGGFAVDPGHPYQPELYVRWLQSGLFSPVFRTHAQQYAEPYHYPQYRDIIHKLVLERYRWLPYNYTLAYENSLYGYPLARPLDFADNSHGAYDKISDEYLWGDELLVAPVLTEGATKRTVTFPKGAVWIDYSDPSRRWQGGTIIADYPAPLDKLPIFVREGSFIPTAEYHMDNTGDYRADDFTISYYASPVESRYTLYDDNHISPRSIADGQYRLLHFSGLMKDGYVTINVSSEGTYPGAPDTVKLDFRIVLPDGSVRSYKVMMEPGNGRATEILSVKL